MDNKDNNQKKPMSFKTSQQFDNLDDILFENHVGADHHKSKPTPRHTPAQGEKPSSRPPQRPPYSPSGRPSSSQGRRPASSHPAQSRRAQQTNHNVRATAGHTNTGRKPGAKKMINGRNRRPYLLNLKQRRIAYVAAAVIAVIILALIFKPENPLKLKPSDSPVIVSEYMTKNTHYFDDKMKTHDWVELYNNSKEDISLSGYKLVSGKKKIKLNGKSISANGYLVVHLDSSGSFALDNNAEGEVFYLKDKKNRLVDLVTTKKIKKNHSVIRSVDSKDKLTEKEFKTPTPGFANNKKGFAAYLETRHAENETGLAFNEVMTSNKNTYVDEFGDSVDYVELINTSDKVLDLSGFGLTDDENDPYAYQFPHGTKLKSGELILVNCSSDYKSKDENGEKVLKTSKEGAYLAPFGIKDGEKLFIADDKAMLIESGSFEIAGSDQSVVRDDDGKYSATYYISPGYPNNDDGVAQYNSTVKTDVDMNLVYISEAMSKNNAYAPVNETEYYDWVELYNPTDSELNLEGYMLSDSRKKPDKFVFSGATIPAKSYLLVYCTDKEISSLHTGFNLNGGCACYLSSPDKKLLDKVVLGELNKNISKGRDNGDSQWKYYGTPTPGAANKNGADSILSAPVADKKSGQYNKVDSISVTLTANGTIYYTTDGTTPSKDSKKYTQPLTLTKTTVVKAIAVSDSAVRSAVATYSYIINENHKMDVVMISGDPSGFFSASSGIFVKGNHASAEFPYFGANFWQGWKRTSTMQLIPNGDKEEGFTIDGETSIFGGYSRGYDKKSFKIKFKDVYGSGSLKYKLFENRDFAEFDSLVLRAGGQDVAKCMMRDDVTTALAGEVVDVMASRPVVVYINGEYYGIYYIREKINDKFVASHQNVSASSVTLIQGSTTIKEGSRDVYQEYVGILEYLRTHNLADDECYKYICDRVDVQNHADFIISELWCANSDLGNYRYYKSTEGDGKWRWIFYDVDMGFRAGATTSMANLLNPNGMGAINISTLMIRSLLQNKQFRKLFVDRLEYQMKNIWAKDNVIAEIDRVAGIISSDIPRNAQRWGYTYNWDAGVEEMRNFARNRQEQLKNEFATSSTVRKYIALTDEELNRCFGY